MAMPIRGHFLNVVIWWSLIILISCDELATKDDPQPTAIELNPIICQDSTFTISWPASEDEDFASYALYEALAEDMSDENAVCESTERADTVFARTDPDDGETYYYRLVVTNTHGNTATSSVGEATADCLRRPEVLEISSIICRDSTLIITWLASEDDYFEAYQLYESMDENMSGAEEIFRSTEREDTSVTVVDMQRDEVRYYRLEVTDTYGNRASSQVLRASAALPDSTRLRIITYQDDSFIITWFAFREEGFVSYALLEAFSEDMIGAQEVYKTSNWDDTTYTIPGIFPEEDRYYRIETTNLCGYTSSSRVELASSALRIAFESDRTGAENIYLMDIQGRNQTPIWAIPDSTWSVNFWYGLVQRARDPIFHPNGEQILFRAYYEGGGDPVIFLGDVYGNFRRLCGECDAASCWGFEFTVTGDAFFHVNGFGVIWKVDLVDNKCSSAGHLGMQTDFGTEGISMSPDGNWFAFHYRAGHGWPLGIGIASVDMSSYQSLLYDINDYCYPIFTPDGEGLIFYAVKPTGANGIYRMSIDGTGLVPLDTTINSIQQVQIQPDGGRILFRRDVSSTWGLFTMDLSGNNQTLLAHTSGEPNNFQYSSDGQYICFDAPVSGRREVFLMNANGSNLTQLTTEGGYSPVIQPRE